MKSRLLLALGCCLLLNACTKPQEAFGPDQQPSRGRYAGIGIYSADRLWREIKGAPESKDPESAKLADDEMVIVITDSQTGEIRQCGNHSGFCVTTNPWASNAKTPMPLPARLSIHQSQLDAEADATVTIKPAAK